MVKDEHLFIRRFEPRINRTRIDIIEKGTLDLCPNVINVGEFIDNID